MGIKKIIILFAVTLTLTGCSSTLQKNTPVKIKDNSGKGIILSSSKANGSFPTENETSNQVSPPPSEVKTNTVSKPFTPIMFQDISSLSKKAIAWSWKYSPKENSAILEKYKGYAFGDTSKKIIYLTFDEGYENGYTGSILDTLKANDVKAAFFVTAPFLTDSFNGVKNIELVKRMMTEGHLICDHSVHHQSMPSFTDEAVFDSEITGVEKIVESTPGLKLSKFFRPPMGDFSELSLYYTQKLGYKSIFFSLAQYDYDVNNQPAPATAKANLLKDTQPGMICLLHAISKTNATILDSLIKEWKSEGYVFESLNDLP